MAFGSWSASSDRPFGIEMPYLTSPSSYQPRMWSAAPLVVGPSPSIAASLMGWSSVTRRAIQSPITSWTGAASAAIVSGTASAMRS